LEREASKRARFTAVTSSEAAEATSERRTVSVIAGTAMPSTTALMDTVTISSTVVKPASRSRARRFDAARRRLTAGTPRCACRGRRRPRAGVIGPASGPAAW
jgi:hypothetical protein